MMIFVRRRAFIYESVCPSLSVRSLPIRDSWIELMPIDDVNELAVLLSWLAIGLSVCLTNC
jgi:hypothetical protein